MVMKRKYVGEADSEHREYLNRCMNNIVLACCSEVRRMCHVIVDTQSFHVKRRADRRIGARNNKRCMDDEMIRYLITTCGLGDYILSFLDPGWFADVQCEPKSWSLQQSHCIPEWFCLQMVKARRLYVMEKYAVAHPFYLDEMLGFVYALVHGTNIHRACEMYPLTKRAGFLDQAKHWMDMLSAAGDSIVTLTEHHILWEDNHGERMWVTSPFTRTRDTVRHWFNSTYITDEYRDRIDTILAQNAVDSLVPVVRVELFQLSSDGDDDWSSDDESRRANDRWIRETTHDYD